MSHFCKKGNFFWNTSNYLRHASYLRNIVAYDHDFLYIYVKYDFSRCFFHFFKFSFFRFLGGKWVKNGPKWQNILSVTLHISETVHHMIVIYGTPVQNDNIFPILKFWLSRLSGGWKGKKNGSNDKNLGMLLFIFQEPYIISSLHLWYICMHERIISPGMFFIFFKIYIFGIVRGGVGWVGGGRCVKGQKSTQNDKKFYLSHSAYQELYIMIVIFGTHW